MIYVLVAFYLDRSGAMLLGAYDNEAEANDRAMIANTSGSAMRVKVIPVTLGMCCPKDIFE